MLFHMPGASEPSEKLNDPELMRTSRFGGKNMTNSMPEREHVNGLLGLTEEEVTARRASYGENRIPEEKRTSAWQLLLEQLKSPLIYIILTAAVVSLVLREYGDFTLIMVVVVSDVILGFVQEYQAQRTYVALKGLLRPTTTVIRDGRRDEIEVWELVPGDLVVLNAGEKAPCDGTLIESTRLSMDESILTGESDHVNKQALTLEEDGSDMTGGCLPSEECSAAFVYMGTTVATGRGILRTVKTGTATELGKIASSLSEQQEADTPFQVRIKDFSRLLTKIVAAFTVLIMAVGLIVGIDFLEMVRTAIILAIAAVPEGLLIAVTVILVLGMRKILKRKGLVKKLLAVETLGSVTVICTDKTGTLTEGRMKVVSADLEHLDRCVQNMVFCNNLEGPVEAALWEYAGKQLGGNPQDLFNMADRFSEELFTSESKFMVTGVTGGPFGEDRFFFLKGAPEIVMSMCGSDDASGKHTLGIADAWADRGLRLLGLAYRRGGELGDRSGYTWSGLVGMEDPVREDVPDAVKLAQQAGIKVKMITGDYRRTAERIAESIGIKTSEGRTMEGDEIASLDDGELRKRVSGTDVFARIRPNEKYRIMSALKANGEITAMIGDGVNDAPALKRADIGVVVGTATDVAKETADLILLDNDFSTVISAIEEGRVIFENVRKVIAYMLSNSFAEVITIFIAMVLGWPAPLLVGQILWIHLICDGPADIVLGFEPKENGIMDEKPKQLKEPILSRMALTLIYVISISSAAFSLLVFNHYYQMHGDAAMGRSIVFASLALNSMIYVFAYRSLRLPIYRMNKLAANKPLVWSILLGLFTIVAAFAIPQLRAVLGLVELNLSQWAQVIGFAFGLLIIVEVAKGIANRKKVAVANVR